MKNKILFIPTMIVASISLTACTADSFKSSTAGDPGAVTRLQQQKTATGTLTANPSTCVVDASSGLCSTTISWSSSDANIVQVKANGLLFAGAQSGSSSAPWITESPVVFELWGDNVLLASVTVSGKKASTPTTLPPVGPSGKLSANPSSCTVNPTTHLCSTTLSWTSSNASDVKVYANGNLFTAGLSGSNLAPWIGTDGVKFELRADNVVVDTITVVGLPSSPPTTVPPIVETNLPVIMKTTDCKATDAASFNACAQGVVSKQFTGIAVMNDITCSGPKACRAHFDHFKGPARIYGYRPDGKNVTIYRPDNYDYSIIEIVTSSDIEIRNLDFREGAVNKPAGLFGTPGYDHNLAAPYDHNLKGDSKMAAPPISIIFQSKNIFVDRIGVYESKLFGMIIGNCDYVTVRNSVFKHNWSNGIWVTNGLSDIVENDHAPINLRIENNRFEDNRCVSIGLSAQGDSWVSGNYMSHNHMGSLWHAPGGQFSVEASTTSLKVVDNEIVNGRIDEDSVLANNGWMVVGFEFSDSHIHGVEIDHNYIHNNSGGGLYHDPLPGGTRSDFGPLIVSDNVIDNPWHAFGNFDAGELILSNNCIDSGSCGWKKSTGKISSSSQTCTVDAAGGCSLNISWSSNPARSSKRAVKVYLDGQVHATSEAGSQSVRLMKGLHRFDLYDGATLLDSVYVGAQ